MKGFTVIRNEIQTDIKDCSIWILLYFIKSIHTIMKVALILALIAVASATPSRTIRVRPAFVKNGSTGRIVGGSDVNEREFPHQISLQNVDFFGQAYHMCGGSVYDENTIITAAHCVIGQRVADLTVIAGAHDIFTLSGNEQVRSVESFVYKPDYDSAAFNNDIAIIKLSSPLVFNSRVQPIRIAESSFEASGRCTNTGWGNVKGDGTVSMPAILQKVELDIIARATCQDQYSGINDITNGMVCAGVGGKGACNGDSGGPLVCLDSANRAYLAGVVSWGVNPCAMEGYPSVYSNVAQYRSWIESVV